MKKEEIEALARLLSEMKDLINELESATKNRSSIKLNDAKRKILELRAQIGRRI